MISPHGGDNMLARFEAGVNTFPHISQIKTFFVNHLYLLNEESQNVPLKIIDLLDQLLVDILYHISHFLVNNLMYHHIHDHFQLFTLYR